MPGKRGRGAIGGGLDAVAAFYARRPGNAAAVLRVLDAQGKSLDRLAPEDLLGPAATLDHQHHGGAEATDELARWAGIRPLSLVLDVGAGLGGPARLLAARYGCPVVALEPVAERARDAGVLNDLVGLAAQVRVVRGVAGALPFAAGQFDACLVQEALLHVPSKIGALKECFRVLRPGGVLAVTEWTATQRLTARDREVLTRTFAVVSLESASGYQALLAGAGFEEVAHQDLSPAWRAAKVEDQAAMRQVLADAPGLGDPEQHAALAALVAQEALVLDLISARKLGGGRFRARRP